MHLGAQRHVCGSPTDLDGLSWRQLGTQVWYNTSLVRISFGRTSRTVLRGCCLGLAHMCGTVPCTVVPGADGNLVQHHGVVHQLRTDIWDSTIFWSLPQVWYRTMCFLPGADGNMAQPLFVHMFLEPSGNQYGAGPYGYFGVPPATTEVSYATTCHHK